MAHTFLKATKIVDTSLSLLETELVLGRTVWNFGDYDWGSAKDDTITLKVPGVLTARDYEWRTRNNPIVFDDITETSYDIKIGGHVYSAVKVTDEQLKLDIVSFADQILSPQARAVAVKLEGKIVDTLTGLPFKTVVQLDLGGTESVTTPGGTNVTTVVRATPYKALLSARKALNAARIPYGDRFAVIGVDLEEAFLSDEQITKYDPSGATSAFREANIGRMAGFEILVSQEIPADEGYVYHRSAVGMAMMAPPVPAGVSFGQALARDGFAMRWIRDYDPNYLQDRSVVSAFYGVQGINDGALIDFTDVDTLLDDPSNIRAVKLELV